jgi:hypothetical protein
VAAPVNAIIAGKVIIIAVVLVIIVVVVVISCNATAKDGVGGAIPPPLLSSAAAAAATAVAASALWAAVLYLILPLNVCHLAVMPSRPNCYAAPILYITAIVLLPIRAPPCCLPSPPPALVEC